MRSTARSSAAMKRNVVAGGNDALRGSPRLVPTAAKSLDQTESRIRSGVRSTAPEAVPLGLREVDLAPAPKVRPS